MQVITTVQVFTKTFLYSLFLLATFRKLSAGSDDFQNRQVSLTGCSGSKQEIFFVVDSSASVGEQNFNTMKSFVKSVVNNLDIGANLTRVGVITYSRYPSMRLSLNAYYDKVQIDAAVDNIPYIQGITETDLALQLLEQEGLRQARPDVPVVAIVITDGQSFHANRTQQAAAALQATGTTVLAVGIGEELNVNELQTIATDPDSNHVFQVTDFQSLHNITESLTARTCGVAPVNTTPPSTIMTSTPPVTFPPLVIDPTAPINTECNKTLADLVFVLDSSGSLGQAHFNSIKQFVMDVVSNLDIGSDLTRVGVITFSNYPTNRITLDQYNETSSLLTAISQIPYYPGNTETDKALDLLRLEAFKNNRVEAPDIAIVVTDGLSTNPDLTKAAAQKVKDAGITVFAIGIGYSVSEPELQIIATQPSSYYTFNVSDYSELPNIKNSLVKTTCDVPKLLTTAAPTPTTWKTSGPTLASTTPVSCTSKVADVIFVIDNSGSIGAQDFERVKSFVKTTINIFDIGVNYTRVGVITYSSTAQLVFGLNVYNNYTEILNAIDTLPFSSGGTNTGAALELLRKSGFINERDNVPNIAILITDGRSKDYDATRQQSKLIKQGGSTLITIGIGNNTDQTELQNIASKDPISGQSLIYNVDSYADLQSLDTVIATLACGVKAYVTGASTTMEPEITRSPNMTCFDQIDNCADYGRDICSDYEPWARAHCNWYCGFCTGGPSTTLAPCQNNIPNCHEYGTYICTEVSLIRWTRSKCAEYCGLCGNNTLPTLISPPRISTSKPDTVCRNKIDNCQEYGGKTMCHVDAYRAWATDRCSLYCGFCSIYQTIPGTILSNNVTCPDVLLPKECTMLDVGNDCCPIPQCPDGYVLTMKSPNQL